MNKLIKWIAFKYETVRIVFQRNYIRETCNIRRKQLSNVDFTIISNNCWGGKIYNSYGMEYLSPTVGMVIYPEDYIKFCKNIKNYIILPLEFIQRKESRYYSRLPDKEYPIAKCGDIELHFLHYATEEEANEKWTRRAARINWNNIVFKFNDQNGCKRVHIKAFLSLSLDNKIVFVARKNYVKGVVVVRGLLNIGEVIYSYEPYGANLFFNVTKYLNSLSKGDKVEEN